MYKTKLIKSFTKYLFLFLIFSSSTYAQYQTEWINKYAGVDLTSSLIDMKSDSMGNIYLCLGDTGYTTIKYSPSGELIWKKHWSLNYVIGSWPKAMTLDKSDNVIVTGADYAITTIKYDTDGNVLWNRRFDTGTGWLSSRDVVSDSKGNIIVGVGITQGQLNHCASFIKYTPDGDTSWIINYINPNVRGGAPFKLSIDSNDNIIVLGAYTTLNFSEKNYLMKISSDGSIKWVNELVNQRRMFKLDIDGDNNIIIGGESDSTSSVMRIEKYDTSGNNIWRMEYYDKEFGYAILHDLKVDDDGNIYIAGREYFTMILNPNGEIKWLKNEIWGNTLDDFAFSLTFDKDKNVYTTGALAIIDSVTNYPIIKFYSVKYSFSGNKMWESEYYNRLMKYSSAGKIILDKFNNILISGSSLEYNNNYFANVTIKYSIPTSIINENEIISEYKLYQNYPNPFNSQTKIKYNLPRREDKLEIKIYDIKGQEIMVMREYNKEAGSYEMNLDFSSQPSGVYFAKISTEKFSDTKKLILIK